MLSDIPFINGMLTFSYKTITHQFITKVGVNKTVTSQF